MIVPFGRYKGKPIEEMLADKEYVKRQIESDSVRRLYPEVVAVLRTPMGLMGAAVVEPESVDEANPFPSPPPTPKTALSSEKRPTQLPSLHQMRAVYHWLTGVDMESRKRCRIAPPGKCRFLMEWLSPEQREAFERHNSLGWRDWQAVYAELVQQKSQ